MARARQVEIVEIPVEQVSYVPGRHADRAATVDWWSRAWRAARQPHRTAGLWPMGGPRTPDAVGAPGPAFWRVIDIAGTRLALVLGGWWEGEAHDDGHLRLDEPHPRGDTWALDGTFRVMAASRRIPVELLLAPHFGPWTLLELVPRRTVHPNRAYFRVGHHCLDRFVAALRAHDGADPAVPPFCPSEAARSGRI
jgi:hypothetical protein